MIGLLPCLFFVSYCFAGIFDTGDLAYDEARYIDALRIYSQEIDENSHHGNIFLRRALVLYRVNKESKKYLVDIAIALKLFLKKIKYRVESITPSMLKVWLDFNSSDIKFLVNREICSRQECIVGVVFFDVIVIHFFISVQGIKFITVTMKDEENKWRWRQLKFYKDIWLLRTLSAQLESGYMIQRKGGTVEVLDIFPPGRKRDFTSIDNKLYVENRVDIPFCLSSECFISFVETWEGKEEGVFYKGGEYNDSPEAGLGVLIGQIKSNEINLEDIFFIEGKYSEEIELLREIIFSEEGEMEVKYKREDGEIIRNELILERESKRVAVQMKYNGRSWKVWKIRKII